MSTRTKVTPRSAVEAGRSAAVPFARAPLVIGLAWALGSAWAPHARADAAVVPAPGHATTGDSARGLRLGGQRPALLAQLARHPLGHGHAARAATTVTVDNCNDNGPGSLREALDTAVSGDVVDLTALDCSTITLDTGLTVPVDDLTLHGPGAAALAIDAAGRDRILAHRGYGTLAIDGLTLRNGAYTYTGPGIYAGLAPGACLLSTGNLTLGDSVVEHCSASGWSVFGAALDVAGTLHLDASQVSHVSADAQATEISATIYGGAIYARAAYVTGSVISDVTVSAVSTSAFSGTMGGGIQGFDGVLLDHSRVSGVHVHVVGAKDAYANGGGVASPKSVILTGSTVSGNVVEGTPGVGASGPYGSIYSSAISGGGVFVATVPRKGSPPSYIIDSTISGNSAVSIGDAGAYTVVGGGGVTTWSAQPFTISNSTISGNSAGIGGGLYARHQGAFKLGNATVTANAADQGAGIYDNGQESGYGFTIDSSIVAGNILPAGSASSELVTIHAIDGSHDLVGSANVALPPDTVAGDPHLAALADNGGPTWTHALLPDSPAIDAGANPDGLSGDQRGAGFLRSYGAATDIGAYERQPMPDAIFADGFD
jgi:hypothetical protein